ncbi:hypothetical protein HAX54_007978 [Datura stramonium]|uniref:Uncharacterized protein n=1 Tax=Datura stramonium TaxID=4076 RepID=A0ABS8TEA5_DATST|nr:hypothetical protein [Datura stramonium]
MNLSRKEKQIGPSQRHLKAQCKEYRALVPANIVGAIFTSQQYPYKSLIPRENFTLDSSSSSLSLFNLDSKSIGESNDSESVSGRLVWHLEL